MLKSHVCFHYLTLDEINHYFESKSHNELVENVDFDELLEPHPDFDIECNDLPVWLNAKFGARLHEYINLGLMVDILGNDINHVKSNTLASLEWMEQVKVSTNLYNISNYTRLSKGELPKLEEQLCKVKESFDFIKDKTNLHVVCLVYTKDW